VLAVLVLAFCAAVARVSPAAAIESAGDIRGYQPAAEQAPKNPAVSWDQFFRGSSAVQKEFAPARSDHAAIALHIGQCYAKDIGHPPEWAQPVHDALLLNLDANLMHRIAYDSGIADSLKPGDHALVLNPFHAAAVSFSDRISRDRLQFGRELDDSRKSSLSYQWIIVALGAAATILISVRAMVQENTQMAKIVGVLAVVASATGASVSSMNTFEGGQAIAARDQRALAQLQQLHWRVASDVLTKPELCRNPADTGENAIKAMEIVGAWRARLEMILDGAVESISKPGDLQGGGGAPPKETPREQLLSARTTGGAQAISQK
jgi:hypothetical protein